MIGAAQAHPINMVRFLLVALPAGVAVGYVAWRTRDLAATGSSPRGRDRQRKDRHRKGLANPRALRKAFPPVDHGLVLATPLQGRRPIVVPPNRSVGFVVAPQQGKSSAAIGYILDHDGPVLATSSKPELLLATAALRSRSTGAASVVFDPLNISGWPDIVRWSPTAGCEQPEVAVRRADTLMAGMSSGGLSDAGFFRSAGSMLLRVCLHAAALHRADVGQVRAWVANPHDTALHVLIGRSPYAASWMSDLEAMTASHGKTLQSIALTTAVALSCLALPEVAQICSPAPGDGFDPTEWLTSGGTLHVVAPEAEAASVAPLTAALVDEVVLAARQLAARTAGGRLDPPLRCVLDELPNIAPLPNLPSYLSDGGGRGVQLVWFAQAASQLVTVFGRDKAATITGATSLVLYGGGLNDPALLRDLSSMLGQVEIRTTVRSHHPGGTGSSEQIREVAVVDEADIYRLGVGEALMMAGGVGGTFVRLPWWEKRRDAGAIRSAIAEAETIRRHPVDR